MLTKDSKRDILNSFLETIKSISDVEYQRKAWVYEVSPGLEAGQLKQAGKLEGAINSGLEQLAPSRKATCFKTAVN